MTSSNFDVFGTTSIFKLNGLLCGGLRTFMQKYPMINRKSILFFYSLTFIHVFVIISYQAVYANDSVSLPFCFTNNSQPISDCKTAIAYRDDQLSKEHDLVIKLFEDNKNKEELISQTINKMKDEINKVKSEWDKFNEDNNKKIAVKITTMTLAVITNKLTNMLLKKNTNLLEIEKESLKHIVDRSNTLIDQLTNLAVTDDTGIDGLVSLPVSMIFILNPTLNITYSAATQVLDWSDLALLFWDKEVENEYYKKRSDILETAIKKLSDKSIHGKIETLMYIKNKIDFYCNNNINITSTGYTNKVSNNYMDKKNCPSSTSNSDSTTSDSTMLKPPTYLRIIQ